MRLLSSASALMTLLMLAAPARADDVEDLIRKANSRQSKIQRIEAIGLLGKTKTQPHADKAFSTLETLAEDKDFEIREAAIAGLAVNAMYNKRPWPLAIVKALFDPDAEVRSTAATHLGPITKHDVYPKEALPLLIKALGHADSNVRSSAMFPIGQIGDKSKAVIDALEIASTDADILVRNNAEIVLWNLNQNWQRYIRHMLMNVAGSESTDPPRELKNLLAIGAAQRIHDLGKDEPEKLAPTLINLFADKLTAVRIGAARSLGAITLDNPKAKAVVQKLDGEKELKKLLEDPDKSVRDEATTALKRIAEGNP